LQGWRKLATLSKIWMRAFCMDRVSGSFWRVRKESLDTRFH
jgi:hypothetical protein